MEKEWFLFLYRKLEERIGMAYHDGRRLNLDGYLAGAEMSLIEKF